MDWSALLAPSAMIAALRSIKHLCTLYSGWEHNQAEKKNKSMSFGQSVYLFCISSWWINSMLLLRRTSYLWLRIPRFLVTYRWLLGLLSAKSSSVDIQHSPTRINDSCHARRFCTAAAPSLAFPSAPRTWTKSSLWTLLFQLSALIEKTLDMHCHCLRSGLTWDYKWTKLNWATPAWLAVSAQVKPIFPQLLLRLP